MSEPKGLAVRKGEDMNAIMKSETIVNLDKAREIGNEWVSPKGETRYYLNYKQLKEVLGLDMEWYKSGNVSRCHYLDENGEDVQVAHSRAWSKYNKIYIDSEGYVLSDWNPYGVNVAEVIARRMNG